MIISYDSVSPDKIKWLNRIVFDSYEFPSHEQIAKIREIDKRLSKEIGWYIEEDGNLISQICYFIYEIQTTDGTVKAGVPLAVGTIHGFRGKGYGKKLMNHVHERMREQGCKYSILSTSSRWYAYNWYKKLGYIDIGSLCTFYGNLKPLEKPIWSIRDFKPSDEIQIGKLFNDLNGSYFGITKRPSNFIYLRDLWKDESINFKIIEENNEIIGFANVSYSAITEISEININHEYSISEMVRFLSKGDTMIFPSSHQCQSFKSELDLKCSETDAIMLIKDLDEKNTPFKIYKRTGISQNKFVAHSLDRY